MKFTNSTTGKCQICHIDNLLSRDDIQREDSKPEPLTKTHHMTTRNKN